MISQVARYIVRAYRTRDTSPGYDFYTPADTLKEAKQRAKYLLSEDFRVSGEMSGRFSYVEVFDSTGMEVVFDLSRQPDKALASIVRHVAKIAELDGVFTTDGATCVKFDFARIVLGYPADEVQLRRAFAQPGDENEWMTVTADTLLFDARERLIPNPMRATNPASREVAPV